MPLKVAGLFIIFCVCSIAGLLKSAKLTKRAEKLLCFERSIWLLAEQIRGNADEISKLLSSCFSSDTVYISNGKIDFNRQYLTKDDICLAEEFFGDIGARDIVGEYERTRMYASLFKTKTQEANEECKRLCRLYCTLGVSGGIFICIFLL